MAGPTGRARRPVATLKGVIAGVVQIDQVPVNGNPTIGCINPEDDSVEIFIRHTTIRDIRSDFSVTHPFFEIYVTTSGPAQADGNEPTGCDAYFTLAYTVTLTVVLWPNTPFQVVDTKFKTVYSAQLGNLFESANGSWKCDLPVEEWADRYAPVDGDGNPEYDLINGTPFPNHGGAAQADGTRAKRTDIYESLVADETATVSVTAFGLTLSLSSAVPQPYAMAYGPQLFAYLDMRGGYNIDNATWYSASATAEITYSPANDASGWDVTGAPWNYTVTDTYTTLGGTYTGDWKWSSGGGKSARIESAGAFGYCGTLSLIEGDRQYRMSARLIDLGGASKTATLYVRETEDSETAHTVPGALDYDVTQVAAVYKALRRPGTSTAPFDVLNTYAIDTIRPIRAYWTFTGEYPEWRAQFQIYPWEALRLYQDASKVISASATLTTDGPVTLTESNLEGYRWLKVPTTIGGARTLTLTINSKDYRLDVPAGSATGYVDLLTPVNIPSPYKKDTRQSRFPGDAIATSNYTPTVRPDINVGDEEGNGWLYGVLDRPTAIGVAGLEDGDSLNIGPFELVRRDSAECRVLAPFAVHAEEFAWESATDNTYLWFLLYLYSDQVGAHRVGPWPYAAHIAPTNGSPDSMVYWSPSDLAGFVASTPGWHAEARPSPYPDPVPVGPDSFAAYILPYPRKPDNTWTPQLALSCSSSRSLYGAELTDGYQTYPGCGDPRLAYGSSNRRTPVNTSKVIRGQSEGAWFKTDLTPSVGSTVQYGTEASPSSWGTGTVGSTGEYRTGSPYARGGVTSRTKAADEYFEKRSGNRYPVRVSWLLVQRAAGGVARMDLPDASAWRAAGEGDGLTVRVANIAGPYLGWDSTYVFPGVDDYANPCLTWNSLNNRAYLVFDGSGGIYESYSDDHGATWSAPTLSDVIPGGKVSRWRHNIDSDCLFTALVDDGDDESMKIVGRWRNYGDLDFGPPFDLTIHMDSPTDPGTLLRVESDPDSPVANYDHSPAQFHDGRWNLSILRPGASAPEDWFSVDDGKLWKPAS